MHLEFVHLAICISPQSVFIWRDLSVIVWTYTIILQLLVVRFEQELQWLHKAWHIILYVLKNDSTKQVAWQDSHLDITADSKFLMLFYFRVLAEEPQLRPHISYHEDFFGFYKCLRFSSSSIDECCCHLTDFSRCGHVHKCTTSVDMVSCINKPVLSALPSLSNGVVLPTPEDPVQDSCNH